MKQKPIIMYGTPTCDDCIRTKKFFTDYDVDYTFIDIIEDDKALKLVEDMNNGAHITPTLVLPDGTVLSAPSNKTLREILGV